MSLLKAFNTHFIEFLEDVSRTFPDDIHIRTAVTFVRHLNKINPSLVVKCWKNYVVRPYSTNIAQGNFDFFLKKDTRTMTVVLLKLISVLNVCSLSAARWKIGPGNRD